MVKRIENCRLKIINFQSGMTYVELIVVLSIFALMTSLILFNYKEFQGRVDIKNLASDIALKIVEAQKASIGGALPPVSFSPNNGWKPSYGIYIDPASNKNFIYFVDLDNAGGYGGAGEQIDNISIAKGNYISGLSGCNTSDCSPISYPVSLIFKRPDSGVSFVDGNGLSIYGFEYIKVGVAAPDNSVSASVRVYGSGRIQID